MMKKTLTAAVAGLALVATQAAAAQGAAPRVGDRIGATSAASDEFAGVPLVAILAGIGVAAAAIAVATGDDSESD